MHKARDALNLEGLSQVYLVYLAIPSVKYCPVLNSAQYLNICLKKKRKKKLKLWFLVVWNPSTLITRIWCSHFYIRIWDYLKGYLALLGWMSPLLRGYLLCYLGSLLLCVVCGLVSLVNDQFSDSSFVVVL